MKSFKCYITEFQNTFKLLDLSDEDKDFSDEWEGDEGDEEYKSPKKDEDEDEKTKKTKFNAEELTKYLQHITASN